MQAILLTLLAVGLAAGVGFLAHRLLRSLTQKLWLRILLSLIPGGMTFFTAGAYLLFTFSVIPATDDPVFSYQDSLSVIIAQSPLPVIDITVAHPKSVKQNNDFTVFLELRSLQGGLQGGNYRAALTGPASAKIRTVDSCHGSSEADNIKESVAACMRVGESQLSFRLAWDISPSNTGTIVLTFLLPMQARSSNIPSWTAQLERNGEIVTKSRQYDKSAKSEYGEYLRLSQGEPVILSPAQPFYGVDGSYVDLGSSQIRVPINIVTTLGVRGSTYEILAVFGTLLSGILGSGWLWNFVSWTRDSGHEKSTERVRNRKRQSRS